MLLILLGLWTPLPSLAAQEPVGGWHAPLWSAEAPGGSDSWRKIPDVTGDGLDDFLLGLRRVVDGADGSVWADFSVDAERLMSVDCGDLTGDGIADLVVGEPEYLDPASEQSFGRTRAYEGGSGRLLWSRTERELNQEPARVALLQDLDGDGAPDLVLFAFGAGRLGVRGADGATLWSVANPHQGKLWSVADRTGDGIGEMFSALSDGDALIDGATGKEVWRTRRGAVEGPPSTVLDLDITHDGVLDLVLAQPGAFDRKGRISVRDGVDGSQIWHRLGADAESRLGTELRLEDLTGDNFPELISQYRPFLGASDTVLSVLDARTGRQLWRQKWREHYRSSFAMTRIDVNQDGVQDFVHPVYDSQADRAWLHASDAATGLDLWLANPLLFGLQFRELVVAEVDQDGVPDLIACVRRESSASSAREGLWAISGATGATLWKREAEEDTSFAFSAAVFATSAGIPAVCSVESGGTHRTSHRLIALALDDGRELWRSEWDQDVGYSEITQLEVVDWNEDGRPELLSRPLRYFWRSFDFLRLHDLHADGRLLWYTRVLSLAWWSVGEQSTFLEPQADVDGDGWLDPRVIGSSRVPGLLHALSGRTGSWRSGLRLGKSRVSSRWGGRTTLEIDAGVQRASQVYRLLFTENGPGQTDLDAVTLPLAPGRWLDHTLAGVYPLGVFETPTGRLDLAGRATLTMEVPPRALAPFLGHRLAFAVSVAPGIFAPPDWSTGAAVLEVLP